MSDLEAKQHEGNIEGSGSWKVASYHYKSEIIPGEYLEGELPYLEREDGMSIIANTANRERLQSFICKGKFGEFRFYASRWNPTKGEPIDDYTVYVYLYDNDWPVTKKENVDLILKYAKDIESALLNYPLQPLLRCTNTKGVWFDLRQGHGKPQPVKAEEIPRA